MKTIAAVAVLLLIPVAVVTGSTTALFLYGCMVGYVAAMIVQGIRYGNWRNNPATDHQCIYAEALGAPLPNDCTKGDATRIISAAKSRNRKRL